MPINQQTINALINEFDSETTPPIFLQPCRDEDKVCYTKDRQVFNRKFDFMPALIVKVRDTSQVEIIVKFITKHELPITVRSGGHDHEGECVATEKVLIDFSLMNQVDVKSDSIIFDGRKIRQLAIQPGARFFEIKKILDEHCISIPHGTCQTVGIAGYTMGGGWGPWTRMYGMGCERLTGATIVLGDGSVRYLGTSAVYNKGRQPNEKTVCENENLLWALRGGGGLSYGIVTELFFEPFSLPQIAISFVIKHDTIPILQDIKAINIIHAWEHIIRAGENQNLIGTNLKVVAKSVSSIDEISGNAVLEWQFNGHFGGTCGELKMMLEDWAKHIISLINNDPDLSDKQKQKMSKAVLQGVNNEFHKVCSASNTRTCDPLSNSKCSSFTFESWDRHVSGVKLEEDCPAPHKITSKMPTTGWNDESRRKLVCSLQSVLLNEDTATSISAYITLGAISGKYYAEKKNLAESAKVKSAFPYEHSAFTIQYQAWWNQPSGSSCTLGPDTKDKLIPTRFLENRAQDWIEVCRDYEIPNTNGSFISFKDASVPTFSYFGKNYQALIDVKLKDSKDIKCLFRTRKTIV